MAAKSVRTAVERVQLGQRNTNAGAMLEASASVTPKELSSMCDKRNAQSASPQTIPTTIDLDAIRQRAEAATAGPWGWRGNVDSHNTHLRSMQGPDVLRFHRSGMNGGRPWFCGIPERFFIQDSRPLAIYQACKDATDRNDPRVYRGDIVGFRHPDAEFIAHARKDVDDLLAIVDELKAALAVAEMAVAP